MRVGISAAMPCCCVPVPSTAVSSYYTQQNEVTSTDNLDFRHHSYKDMRQVGTAWGADPAEGEIPSRQWNTLSANSLSGILCGVGTLMVVGSFMVVGSSMRNGCFCGGGHIFGAWHGGCGHFSGGILHGHGILCRVWACPPKHHPHVSPPCS